MRLRHGHRWAAAILSAGLLVAGCSTAASPGATSTPGSAAAESVRPTATPGPATAVPTIPQTPTPSPTTPAPSGELLVFRNPDPWEPYGYVWAVAADGTNLRKLGAAVEASWSADGRRVHLVAPGPDCVPSLVTETPDGSGRVVVSRGLRSLDSGFAWSPDERQVAFLRFRDGPPPKMCGSQGGTYGPLVIDLWVMQADGSSARVVVRDFPLSGLRSFGWSPDSSRIAYFPKPDASGTPSAVTVNLVRVADGQRSQSATAVLASSANGLTWSPDGTRSPSPSSLPRAGAAPISP